ncbi:putative ribonuclease H-like domain-containing protein, partial [Tanacetum coccineum]
DILKMEMEMEIPSTSDFNAQDGNLVQDDVRLSLSDDLKKAQDHNLEEKGVIDSGYSRHMTGNISYLTDFKEIDGGYVAFGGNPKGGKITGRATKDETSDILKSFITGVENLIDQRVKAEAVNTACYVQNRVLVTKPHNKTPYEIFLGRKPTLYFMKPFGCLVLILNTIDHLGKFDGKANEGFFVRYSINSKAFRVFNSRTRIVEENLHIQFSENTPNIAGSGPNWLFDIDALTKSMNYKPVVAGNQSNSNAGTKACDDAGKARMETVPSKDYILLPLWTADPPFSQSLKSSPDARLKPSGDDEKKVTKELGDEGGDPSKEGERDDQEKDDNVNSTNNVNATGINEVNNVNGKTSIKLLDDPNMSALEDIVYSDDNEDVGAEADMNNLDAFMPVSPIPTTRIYKDHPVEQIIGDLNSTPQTRRMTKNLEEYRFEEPKKVIQALKDPSWIEAMQEELLQFRLQEVWTLADLPNGKRAIGTKWVFRNKKDERGIEVYVYQPLGFKDPDFPDRVYKVEKALYELHQALKHDDIIFGSTKKSLCTEFEKMMHKKFQMSSMGELTFFLGLQVKQKEDGIFISQDKYVTEILKKFGFTDVKTASTPMETQKPLLKDEDGEEVDVHLYRSMIGSLMYLTSSRPDIMFVVCAYARYQVNPKVSHLHAVKRIFRYLKGQPKLGLWYPKDSPFDLVAYTDSDYVGASLDRKSTIGEKPTESAGFEEIFWSTAKAKTINGETQIHALVDGKKIVIPEISVRRDLQLANSEGIDCFPNTTIFENLALMGYEKSKDNSWNEFSSVMASAIICLATNQKFNFLKLIFDSRMKNLDGSNKFLMYLTFVQLFLDNLYDKLTSHKRIYVTPFHTKKIFANMRRTGKDFSRKVTPLFATMLVQHQSAVGEGSAIPTDPQHTPTIDQLSITQPITSPSTSQPKNTQKPRKPKRKDIEITQSSGPTKPVADEAIYKERDDSLERDATTASSLEAEKVSGSGPRRQDTMGDIIAQTWFENMFKTSNDLLPAGVNTPLSDGDTQEITSLKLDVKKLEKKGGSRTYKLKRLHKIGRCARMVSSDEASLGEDMAEKEINMAEKEVASVEVSTADDLTLAQTLMEKKKVNTFVDMDTDMEEGSAIRAEGSSKRAGEDLQQESTKKQKLDDVKETTKVDEDKETTELQSLMEVIPDEEEVAVDAIPLATKPPSIVGWKIYKEGQTSYCQITRADGCSKMYLVFSQLLKSFDMEDLETL